MEETKGRSVTPLQNISNGASSEEVGHVEGEGIAPPAKRARTETTEEGKPSEGSDAAEKADEVEPAALLTADDVMSTSPEGKFNIAINKEHIILKSTDSEEQHTIPTDSIGRIFVLPQEDRVFIVLALITPLMAKDSTIVYSALELPVGKEAIVSEAKTERAEKMEDDASDPVTGAVNEPLIEAMPKLLSSVTGLDVEKSVLPSSPSMFLSVPCTYNGESGYLFPLEDGFFFLHKPLMYIAFSDVFKAKFVDSKDSEEQSDLVLTMKDGKTVEFCHIRKNDHGRLDIFGIEKRIAEGGKRVRREAASASNLATREEDEDSDDDDFLEDRAKIKDKEEGENAISGSDEESEPLEEYESDVQDTTQEDVDEETEAAEEEEGLEEDGVEVSSDEGRDEEAAGEEEEKADGKGVTEVIKSVVESVEEREPTTAEEDSTADKETIKEGPKSEKDTESADKEELAGEEKESGSVEGGTEKGKPMETGTAGGDGTKEGEAISEGCEIAKE